MDSKTQSHIGKIIIYVFLGVTAVLVLTSAFGLSEWAVVKDILQAWSATYSVLVGAVVGYYFRVNSQIT